MPSVGRCLGPGALHSCPTNAAVKRTCGSRSLFPSAFCKWGHSKQVHTRLLHLDLGLPDLRNVRKKFSLLYTLPSLWYSVMSAQNGLRQHVCINRYTTHMCFSDKPDRTQRTFLSTFLHKPHDEEGDEFQHTLHPKWYLALEETAEVGCYGLKASLKNQCVEGLVISLWCSTETSETWAKTNLSSF